MSQSSIIFPVYMPLSIDSFIDMMNRDERGDGIQKNTLIAIKQFVSDDINKFMQVMQLESKPEKTSLIQVAAQNGRHDIVKYLIDQAMKTELGQQTLRNQLIRVDIYDRSIIHWIAQINKDAVGQCLAAILDAGNQLGIFNYVNLKENMFNATPLMMAVKQGAIANIRVLIEHGADIYVKSRDDETVLDLIKYTDPKISIPTMKYFIKNTSFGYETFIKIHGDEFKKIYDEKDDKTIDKILSTLIAIDMDASLPHELAQLSALKLLVNGTMMAHTMNEVSLILATHSQINFVKALQGYKTQIKDEKHSLINDIFEKTLKTSSKFNLSESNTAIFAEANLLLSFQLPEAHKSAFSLFMQLMIEAPDVALEGFKKINTTYLDADFHFLLIRNTLFAMTSMKITKLTPIVHDNILLRFFDNNTLFSHRQEKMDACDKLKILLDEINNAKNMPDLQTAVKKISMDTKLSEDPTWAEMMNILNPATKPSYLPSL